MPRDHRQKPQEQAQDDPTATGTKQRAREYSRDHPFVSGGIGVILIAVLVSGVIWWLVERHYESTDDAFIDARQFAVAPKISGYIVAVPVTDNQHVSADKVLFRIDSRDYRIALEQAKAQVAATRADITTIEAQIAAQQAQVKEAQAQVDEVRSDLSFARKNAKRYASLLRDHAGTVQQKQKTGAELAQQEANLASAKAKVAAAKRQVAATRARRANAAASLAEAQARRDKAALALSYTTVRAAQAGHIVQLAAAVGQYVQPGQSLAMFVPDAIWVTANFKETQITDMRPGQPVQIEVDAYPDHDLKGRVDSIQPGSGTAFSLLPAENATGNYVNVVQRVPVKIVIDNPPSDLPLGPGLSVVPSVRVR
jgi:membrane fusion protein (multidrug efflux system)